MSDTEDSVTEHTVDQELGESDSVPDSSLVHITTGKMNPLISEHIVGMEAFTDIMINKNLTQEELQSQLARKFNSLVCISDINLLSFYNTFTQTRYADSIGLNLSVGLLPSCSSSVPSISGPM